MRIEDILFELCEIHGYGNVMSTAARLWKQKDKLGGSFVVGPCASMVVPCECKNPVECDWCCGTGWLTKKVKLEKCLKEGIKL